MNSPRCHKIILSFIFYFVFNFSFSQIENYYLNNKTPKYNQVIKFYDSIAKKVPAFKLISCGKTDVGIPLHLFVISKSKQFAPSIIHKQKKVIMMINNGIHPGEPDGIDACINLVRNYALNPKSIPDSVVICLIPILNIDGSLIRNSVMRMNQNGPEEFGFRGNSKNLDLNRDMIKCDAENTRSFIKIFHEWEPELFIDTHVSNGADYPYTMTLIYPNSGKIKSETRQVPLPETLTQDVIKMMEDKAEKICPYVESVASTPDSGLYEFNQTPRYITGFTSLFNTISYVTESHMLKPYNQRVKATKDILNSFIEGAIKYRQELKDWKVKRNIEEASAKLQYYNWKTNKNVYTSFLFNGYKATYVESKISGLKRLRYEKNTPWQKDIPFYNSFIPGDTIIPHDYYIIPQCWKSVIEIMENNNIKMTKLRKDTSIMVEAEYIKDFKTVSKPYEGHYMHYDIKTKPIKIEMNFLRGDYLVPVRQKGIKFLIEALEPKSNDGFFAWNFFDAVLQQKEWFSDYAFEEVAEKILSEQPEIKKQLELEKEKNPEVKNNHWEQLNFIFQKSKYKEKSHNLYPVFKLTKSR